MQSSKAIIEKLEDLLTTTGRFGNYETSMVNTIIDDLAQTPLFTLADINTPLKN